jgi:muramoyltetrapeptide carboxypeptidase
MPPLQKPPHLHPGSTLGVIAPSNPLLPGREGHYRASLQILTSLGFQIKEGRALRGSSWWTADRAAQADDIHAMFADPDVHALIAVAGGAAAAHVVDLLDYDLIRRCPKPFLGMSDITVYHWAMWTQAGLVGFHGNTLTAGWSEWYQDLAPAQQRTLKALYRRLLTVPAPVGPLPALTPWTSWRDGSAEGVLLGGLLRRFVALAGTRYFPPPEAFDGAILFWEESDRPLADIALSLAKLRHLGIFERLGGMVVGKVWLPPQAAGPHDPTLRDVVLALTQPHTFPILADVDFGHRVSMLPLPIGVAARMDSAERRLALAEAATRG